MAEANAANPDWMPQINYLRETPPPASYATAPYFSVNTFVFVDKSGAKHPARWVFEPVAGRVGLTPEERQARGTDFLQDELRQRVASSPAEWRMLLVLPREGDPLNDATKAWPADREQVEAGRLRINAVTPAGQTGACEPVMFNPLLLPNGMESLRGPDPASSPRALRGVAFPPAVGALPVPAFGPGPRFHRRGTFFPRRARRHARLCCPCWGCRGGVPPLEPGA